MERDPEGAEAEGAEEEEEEEERPPRLVEHLPQAAMLFPCHSRPLSDEHLHPDTQSPSRTQ